MLFLLRRADGSRIKRGMSDDFVCLIPTIHLAQRASVHRHGSEIIGLSSDSSVSEGRWGSGAMRASLAAASLAAANLRLAKSMYVYEYTCWRMQRSLWSSSKRRAAEARGWRVSSCEG